ncbi:hypothetical protein B0A54_16425 [Friedmanniomyces endolithicus]|uniref:MAPEG family protein n=1 Tax=Friedmanniomyces endolithicus TaxID=329885 RepID=A0A4U0TZM3_9PEZI|nr:hypothetical protein LTS09_015929 [Friedmanniomyces endolithicus]TKA28050.1 hypothetical protein B0A54_16425 [Friedmanniomyces endolithicus]
MREQAAHDPATRQASTYSQPSTPTTISSLLTALGLRAASPLSPDPNLAASHIITHFALAYLVLASRTLKQIYSIDHNVSPREDLGKYGDAAVRNGKITQRQLEQLKRMESASANSVENFTLFVGAMLLGTMAGVPATDVNATGLAYTVARCGYAIAYVLIDAPSLSQVREVCWWVGNSTCLRLLWVGGVALNSKTSGA